MRRARRAAPGEQPAACEGERVAGDAEHQPVGDVVEAVVPDRGADRLGMDEIVAQADFAGEVEPVGNAGQERVGAGIDPVETGEGRPVDATTDAARMVEQHDLVDGIGQVGGNQPVGGGGTRDPGSDDGDATVLHGPGQPTAPVSTASTTRAARADITSASSLTHAVRSNRSPASSARCRASMSRSYSTSR